MTLRISSSLLLCVIAVSLWAPPLCSQTEKEKKPDEAVKLRTDLIALDVQIVDRKSQQNISGLTQSDFEIYEEGVKQEITQFSQAKLPLSVVLLLDASGSMWAVLERLRANALRALQALGPEDEVAIFATADETHLIQDFTKEKFNVAETLATIDFKSFGDGGIHLHDSLYRAAYHLQKAANPAGRRVIIVVTDNIAIPNYNWRAFSKEQAISLLLETGVAVCGLVIKRNLLIQVNIKLLGFPGRKAGGDVHNYAEITGGETLSVGDDTIGEKLVELIRHLRSRYTLAFVSSNGTRDGKFRRLKVKLAHEAEQRIRGGSKDYSIATRSGYYAARN
jgi:VWFA-related protein